MTPVLVFDIETIPDVEGLRRVWSLPAELPDAGVAELAFERRREKTGSDFLPLHMHRVVIHLPSSPLLKERQAVKRQAAPTLETPTLSTPAPLAKVIIQPAQPKTRTPRGAPDQWMRNE